jgi:hypothetical protein
VRPERAKADGLTADRTSPVFESARVYEEAIAGCEELYVMELSFQ